MAGQLVPGGHFLLGPSSYAVDGDGRIDWVCQLCAEPIVDGAGYLALDYAERQRAKTSGRKAHWMVLHKACDDDLEAASRWWAIERVRTLRQLLHWAGHVGGKSWIGETDWVELLAKVGRP